MDAMIPLPEPVESWDVLLWAFVAGLALGIYRASQGRPEGHARTLADRTLAKAQRRATEE